MNQKGIALIMAVGVLALLAIIATSFALNMRLEYHAAMNYYSGVKARYFAEAALERAIAELRDHVKSSAFDDITTETWGTSDYVNSNICDNISSNGTSQTTSVVDEQRKININNANETLLKNLISYVKNTTANGVIKPIYDEISGNGPYSNLRELRLRAKEEQRDDIDELMPYVTINTYIDPNTKKPDDITVERRSPINVNTADQKVIAAVIKDIKSGKSDDSVPVKTSAISKNNAWEVADHIINGTKKRPFTSWKAFEDAVDTAVPGHITADEATVIKYNCNPNRPKPSTSTTEFCFNSGGYYTVTATGSVTGTLGAAIASNTLSAVVKIYDIYCETKVKDSTTGNPTQFALGKPERVTWLGSCPVRSDQVFGTYAIPTDYEKIENSIKLGFWDDFSDATYSGTKWNCTGAAGITGGLLRLKGTLSASAKASLASTLITGWENYYSVSLFEDDVIAPSSRMSDVGWIFVKGTNSGDPAVLHAGPVAGAGLSWSDEVWAYQKPGAATGVVTFMTKAAGDALGLTKYKYSPQIRIFRIQNEDAPENNDTDIYRTFLTYDTKKRYNITVDKSKSKIATTVYTTSPLVFNSYTTLSDTSFNIGFAVYTGVNTGDKLWDDIRLIPRNGNFTSQPINSTISPGIAGNVGWGTITGTVTIPGLLTIPPTTTAGSETVTFQTKSNADGVTWKDANPAAGGAMGSIAGSSIQYKALLTTADSDINETPVLEDVTITYLPKVSIKSFSLSN